MNLAWAKNKIKQMAAAMRKSKHLTDNMTKGYLSIYKEYGDGKRERVLDNDPNVIMYAARRHHLAFLYDTTAAQDLLASFKVGSGGAIGSNISGNTNIKVLSPDPSRDDLYNPIELTNNEIEIVASDSDSDEVYIQILFTLGQDEANGTSINECGIFKDSGDIFNHKCFSSVPKSETFSLIFDWRIRYI